MTSLYERLGVPSDATQQDIKASYRKMAQKHHPDRPEGDKEAFVAIQHAYDVLSDEAKRARYDQDGFDGTGPDIRMLAIQQLAGLFMQMIAEEATGDLIEKCLQAVAQTTSNFNSDKARHESGLQKLEKYRARVVNKHGKENIFLMVVDGQINGTKAQIADIEQKLAVIAVVGEILREHEDTAPTAAQPNYGSLQDMIRHAHYSQGSPFGSPFGSTTG